MGKLRIYDITELLAMSPEECERLDEEDWGPRGPYQCAGCSRRPRIKQTHFVTSEREVVCYCCADEGNHNGWVFWHGPLEEVARHLTRSALYCRAAQLADEPPYPRRPPANASKAELARWLTENGCR